MLENTKFYASVRGFDFRGLGKSLLDTHGQARDLAKLALGEHESLNVASKDNDNGPDTCPGMDRRPRWLAPRGAATPWWALRFSYNPSSVSTSRFREAGSGRPSDSSHGLTGSDPGRGKSYG